MNYGLTKSIVDDYMPVIENIPIFKYQVRIAGAYAKRYSSKVEKGSRRIILTSEDGWKITITFITWSDDQPREKFPIGIGDWNKKWVKTYWFEEDYEPTLDLLRKESPLFAFVRLDEDSTDVHLFTALENPGKEETQKIASAGPKKLTARRRG